MQSSRNPERSEFCGVCGRQDLAQQFTLQIVLRLVLGLLVIVSLAGCERRIGEAIVLTKEHIAAARPTATKASGEEASSPANAEGEIREIKDDEITVDGYVMTPEVRGSSRDPRALKEEQWRVKVRMISDGRTFTLQTDRSDFDKLKEGNHVRVAYRVGKYTGTVWGAELEKSKN